MLAWLNQISIRNLRKLYKVLEIILDELEIQGENRISGNKISLKRFENENISREETISIIEKINKEEHKTIFEVLNYLLEDEAIGRLRNAPKPLNEFNKNTENQYLSLETPLGIVFGISKKDLEKNLIIITTDLNIIKNIKKEVDKKIKTEDKMTKKEENRPVELFTNDVVPNRTAEIEKNMREERIRQTERTEREKLHKEQMKQNRILATKIDKFNHALDLVIEWAEFSESNFSIDYYYFNFEDRMDDSKILEKFLTEMQKNGCFEKYTRTNYTGGTKFGFIKANIKNLKKFREEITKGRKQGNKKLKGGKKIKKITIIEMNNGKHLIAINDNYDETKQIKNYSEWWQIFIIEIKERDMTNRTNIKEIPKDMVDYFNYNKGKCPIYMGGKYDLTNIFVGRSIDTMISPEIKTKIMTERQFLARKNRKKKK